MESMDSMGSTDPQIAVAQMSTKAGAAPGLWLMRWEVSNLGAGPINLLSTRLPHGRLRSEEVALTPPVEIGSNETRSLELQAYCSEPAQVEFENAFLILRTLWHHAEWLVLARLTVRVGVDGAPHTETALITAQKVGFSEARGNR